MANLNKIDVPIAVEHKTKLDLSCDHVTTMGFMTMQPVNYRHMIKGEHISINASSSIRPAPIEVPVYGMLKQNLRYFFVPYRLVFPNWDEFYNDVIASNYQNSALVPLPPILPNVAIVNLFLSSGFSIPVPSDGDFFVSGNSYKYTKIGRFALKIFRSLGYEPIYDTKPDDLEYNALGFLAFVRVFIDWYANSQYLNTADVLLFERLTKYNDPTTPLVLTSTDLHALIYLIGNVVYDTDDYYVNAWDNPVSPISGQFSGFSFADPTTSNGAYVQTNTLGSPEMLAPNTGVIPVGTTYIHEALKRLTDFQKRHQLAGARSIDRVLAQYGVIQDYLKLQRSVYLGNQQTTIDIGSVYATASSQNSGSSSDVGDYSGAGFGNSSGSIDFQCSEEGILICIASIIPSGRIVQGYDRNNLHLSKEQFFVPEFDSLGVQVIQKGEVYVSPSNASFGVVTSSDYKDKFGFSGRYAEYKRPKSFLTGDISLPKFYSGGDSWHLFRLFSDASWNSDIANVTHSLSFTRGADASQYHRMFQYTNDEFDPFYCFFHFNIASFAPCRPLFESYEFESNSKKVPTENGNKVN